MVGKWMGPGRRRGFADGALWHGLPHPRGYMHHRPDRVSPTTTEKTKKLQKALDGYSKICYAFAVSKEVLAWQ